MNNSWFKCFLQRCDEVTGLGMRYADGVAGEPKKIEGRFIPYTKGGVEIGRPHG